MVNLLAGEIPPSRQITVLAGRDQVLKRTRVVSHHCHFMYAHTHAQMLPAESNAAKQPHQQHLLPSSKSMFPVFLQDAGCRNTECNLMTKMKFAGSVQNHSVTTDYRYSATCSVHLSFYYIKLVSPLQLKYMNIRVNHSTVAL